MKKQKIIDFHSHLGDIFATKQNVIYDIDKKVDTSKFYRNPFDTESRSGFLEPLLDPSKPEELVNLCACSEAITLANTLQRLTERMDEFNLVGVCEYPILPWVGFEDYLAAKSLEPRIIPFTSADWRRDVDWIIGKLKKDVARGAKGLKIHPVIQPISLQDPKVKPVLEYWATTGLPVTSHCGENSYYCHNQAYQKTECPENGHPKYFVQAVKENSKNLKWVSAHAGGLTGWELDWIKDELKGYGNVWYDTTFRSVEDIKKMVNYFGAEKCLYGTDTPFSYTDDAIKSVYGAVGEGTDNADKILYRNAVELLGLGWD
jgi:hypothetical protein